MRILVTGGAGFIGSHVVDHYISEGHDVAILDDFSAGKMENVNSFARIYNRDIREFGQVWEVIAKEKPDVVNHHAAHISVIESIKNPIYDTSINVMGTLNLLDNCIRHGVKKFIFASSGGTLYGGNSLPYRESSTFCPISPYGVSKAAVEIYLSYFYKIKGLNCVSLRYSNVYGPRQNPDGEAGVVAIFTKKMLSGDTVTINGDGSTTRDYVYVEDVAKANSLALSNSIFGSFNIGTGIETNVNTILKKLSEIIKIDPKVIYGPEILGEQKRSFLDCSLIMDSFGWHPMTNLEDGLKKTVDYFISMKGEGRL
jgi:UDP-glucose 4-epimerase